MKYFFAGCELDTVERSLQVDGRVVHIERQVFEILLLLADNKGRLVTRDELLIRIWNGRIVSESSIASRINAARRAIRDDGRRQDIIETVSGMGFRMVAEVSMQSDSVGRPAVAILPLELLGSNKADVNLARGVAEQLAGTLGHASHIDIIDTAASFSPALQSLSPAKIGECLSARYLVTGSFQSVDDKLRIQLRLTATADGLQVWAGTFDGTRQQIFELQDRLALAVLGEIAFA